MVLLVLGRAAPARRRSSGHPDRHRRRLRFRRQRELTSRACHGPYRDDVVIATKVGQTISAGRIPLVRPEYLRHRPTSACAGTGSSDRPVTRAALASTAHGAPADQAARCSRLGRGQGPQHPGGPSVATARATAEVSRQRSDRQRAEPCTPRPTAGRRRPCWSTANCRDRFLPPLPVARSPVRGTAPPYPVREARHGASPLDQVAGPAVAPSPPAAPASPAATARAPGGEVAADRRGAVLTDLAVLDTVCPFAPYHGRRANAGPTSGSASGCSCSATAGS